MIELPNEIILMVIDHLPQKSRKQMRLVCRIWVSPYEKDMEGFKHSIYDSAQFASDIQADADYLRALCDDTGNFQMGCMSYSTIINDCRDGFYGRNEHLPRV